MRTRRGSLGASDPPPVLRLRTLSITSCFDKPRCIAKRTYQRLAHIVGVNTFFCHLERAARRGQDMRLRWVSERAMADEYGDVVRPDGAGIWTDGGRRVDFCLEYDRSTETVERVVAKLDGYAKLVFWSYKAAWVLFWFPSDRREANVRRAMANTTLPVATAHAQLGKLPSEAVWLPVGASRRRLRLTDLADAPMPPVALARLARAREEWAKVVERRANTKPPWLKPRLW